MLNPVPIVSLRGQFYDGLINSSFQTKVTAHVINNVESSHEEHAGKKRKIMALKLAKGQLINSFYKCGRLVAFTSHFLKNAKQGEIFVPLD